MDDAQWKWMKTPEAQKIATAAQEKAWKELQQQFPRADRRKFVIQADFIKNHKAIGQVFLKTSDGLTSVFGSDSRYWSQQMKTALGIADVNNGFPPAVAAKNKKPTVNPGGGFYRNSLKHKRNVRRLDKNLRNTKLFLSGEIKGHI